MGLQIDACVASRRVPNATASAGEARAYNLLMKTIVYGIPNCDSVKKARALLDERSVPYEFHDYKKLGVPEAELRRWVKAKGRDVVLNRKGSTWPRSMIR